MLVKLFDNEIISIFQKPPVYHKWYQKFLIFSVHHFKKKYFMTLGKCTILNQTLVVLFIFFFWKQEKIGKLQLKQTLCSVFNQHCLKDKLI